MDEIRTEQREMIKEWKQYLSKYDVLCKTLVDDKTSILNYITRVEKRLGSNDNKTYQDDSSDNESKDDILTSDERKDDKITSLQCECGKPYKSKKALVRHVKLCQKKSK
jgi:hypothetical protein